MFKKLLNRLNKQEETNSNILDEYIDSYKKFKSKYSNVDPHQLLTYVWLELNGKNYHVKDKKKIRDIAYSETYNFSCLPEPVNVKALALWYMYKEYSALLGYQNHYLNDVRKLLKPVFIAKKKGHLEVLYNKYNSKLSSN